MGKEGGGGLWFKIETLVYLHPELFPFSLFDSHSSLFLVPPSPQSLLVSVCVCVYECVYVCI